MHPEGYIIGTTQICHLYVYGVIGNTIFTYLPYAIDWQISKCINNDIQIFGKNIASKNLP